MDFELTVEQNLLRDGARRFIREEYAFEARQAIVRSEAGYSTAHWQSMAELGWLALALPEEAGGFGLSFVDVALLLEELGRGLVVEPFLSTAVLGARMLELAGTEPAAAVLQGIATGDVILALAHDEPGERHRRNGIGTLARRSGNGFCLNGTKTVVLDAPLATHLIVSARIEDGAELALFLLPADEAAALRQDYRLIDGTRAADFAFQDIAVSPAALLLEGPNAVAALEDALDRVVLGQVAFALGAMEAVLHLTSEYLKTRVQFGQPIWTFQALQHRMAEMFTETQSARSMLFQGLAAIDGPAAERAAAISAAKVAVSRAGFFTGGQGMQLHGGMGMTEEVAVGHYFKWLVAMEKTYGDTDWHLARFSRLRVA